VKSQEAMAQAMKGVTKALTAMNKKMDIPGLQKLMKEFMKENERAEFMQEAMGDSIDDAMEEPGSAEQEDLIVNQVLDELGVSSTEGLTEAPSKDTTVSVGESKQGMFHY
jgi:charged multivesicular body protein 2A